jgi:serine/threonine protein kinase
MLSYVRNLILSLVRSTPARERAVQEAGPYTLEQQIGAGGMGVVYRARHASLDRPAAVKVLAPARRGDAVRARLFAREAQLTSRLRHPNTISIYDYGSMTDGSFYYAMEYVDGVTLEDLVVHDGAQPAARVVRLLEQICGALEEAHGQGLVHRDIKPSNVMVTRGRKMDLVKVLDFGLVMETGTTAGADPSLVMGTPLYLAPEAITNPGGLDARADIYAVGAVGYYLLTGVATFAGNSFVEACMKQLYEDPVRPSLRLAREVPPELEALIMSCLARDPAARPQSATEVLERLATIARDTDWTPRDAAGWWSTRGAEVHAALVDSEVDACTATLPVAA